MEDIPSDSRWECFFRKHSIVNFQGYLQDIEVLKSIERSVSYPIFLLPTCLLNEAKKKPPFDFTGVQLPGSYLFYQEKRAFNLDMSKVVNIAAFYEIGSALGFELSNIPLPQKPEDPSILKQGSDKHNQNKMFVKGGLYLIFFVFAYLIHNSLDYTYSIIRGCFLVMMIVTFVPSMIFLFVSILSLFGYRQRKQSQAQQYQEKMEIYHQILLPQYNQALKEYKEKIKQKNDKFNILFPLIQKALWKEKMLPSFRYEFCEESPKRGKFENELQIALEKIYPHYIQTNIVLCNYYPDILLDIEGKAFVDIEIDEPYELTQKKVIHYIGSGDEIRNQTFVQNNWFVLRFCEDQIKYRLLDCMQIIHHLINFIQTGDVKFLSKMESCSEKIEVPRWTFDQGSEMAQNDSRLRLI